MLNFSGEGSNWLADAEEVRDLRKHSDDVVLCDTNGPPPPPSLPPSRTTVDEVVRQLLASGVWATATDIASGNTYFFDTKSRATTWNLHALVERDFYLFKHLAKVDAASSPSPSGKSSAKKQNGSSDAQKARLAGPTSPSPHKTSIATQPHTVSKAEWRDRIYKLYKEHNPSHVMVVDELLIRYEGNEEQLWRNLMSKYPARAQPGQSKSNASRRLFDGAENPAEASPRSTVRRSSAPRQPAEAIPDNAPRDKRLTSSGKKQVKVAEAPLPFLIPAAVGASPHPAPDPDVESPSKQKEHESAAIDAPPQPQLDEQLPPTPDVSAIHSQDDMLQSARAAAERKAMLILNRNKQAPSTVTGARVNSPKAWEKEQQRREAEARQRREILRQEKLEAQRRRKEEVDRRAKELERIRAEELELQRQHKLLRARSLTPSRRPAGHADPTVNALGKENLVGVTEKRLERAESSTRERTASAPRRGTFDVSSPAYSSNWHTSRLIANADAAAVRSFTPERASAKKKLNPDELKASVERLTRHRSTPTKASPAPQAA